MQEITITIKWNQDTINEDKVRSAIISAMIFLHGSEMISSYWLWENMETEFTGLRNLPTALLRGCIGVEFKYKKQL